MTILAHGDRFDAIESFRALENVEYVYFVDEDNPKPVHTFWMRWRTATNPRKHLVFVNPPKLELGELSPRPGRHIVITEGRQLPQWLAWAKKHKVEVQAHALSPQTLIALLVAGDSDFGIPKFRRNAAEHLVQAFPGGVQTLYLPIMGLQSSETPEPISLEAVLELCPLTVSKGPVYTVSAVELLKNLGSARAIALAAKVPAKEAYGPLIYARKKYTSEVIEVQAVHPGSSEVLKKCTRMACLGYENRVTFLDAMLTGIEQKCWNPRAALVLFSILCLLEASAPAEANCPSPSSKTSSSSQALRTLSQLLNMT